MNTTNIIALALGGLLTLGRISMAGEDSKPLAEGEETPLLQDINMFIPEEGAPAFKHKACTYCGTQWAVDMAYAFWGTHNALPRTRHKNNYALLHAQVNQRLLEDVANGGTWLRAEFSGSWALDHATRTAERRGQDFVSSIGLGTEGHADMYGANGLYLPELALMQYFNGERACLIAGMVNLSNYFDAIGIANDSFSHFVNTGFVNSCILPLPCGNLGAIAQWSPDNSNYLMLAGSGTDTEMGYNPFHPESHGYCIVGEYGHIFAEGAATLRLTPFYQNVDADDGRHDRCGIAASIEYTPWEPLTVYARAGAATKQTLGGTAELSCGATWAAFPCRQDDFFGLSYGLFKHSNSDETGEPSIHHREHVIEFMYSLQLCDHVKLVPHFQYIHHPAYRADTDSASIFGAQAVLSF